MSNPDQSTPESRAEAARIAPYWRRAQVEVGLTQVKLSQIMGVGQSSVNRWLTGKQPIPTERLMELSALLHFDPTKIRPSMARYVRPLVERTISERAATLASLFDKLDDQGQTIVETMAIRLLPSSESQ